MMSIRPAPVAKSWRLGTDLEPGWFDTTDLPRLDTSFFMATVFALRWQLDDPGQDAIHDLLHGMTLGWRHLPGKIHIEHIAQILGGKPHITARITDLDGGVHRTTQPLSDDTILTHRFLLLYSGRYQRGILTTASLLRDLDADVMMQTNFYQSAVIANRIEFMLWAEPSVICDHEQRQAPRDHVMVNGHARCIRQAPFKIFRVCGMLGHDLDVRDPATAAVFSADAVSDIMSGSRFWYCADADHAGVSPQGRYRHPAQLGLLIDPA